MVYFGVELYQTYLRVHERDEDSEDVEITEYLVSMKGYTKFHKKIFDITDSEGEGVYIGVISIGGDINYFKNMLGESGAEIIIIEESTIETKNYSDSTISELLSKGYIQAKGRVKICEMAATVIETTLRKQLAEFKYYGLSFTGDMLIIRLPMKAGKLMEIPVNLLEFDGTVPDIRKALEEPEKKYDSLPKDLQMSWANFK